MKIEKTPLEGPLVIHPDVFNDERGFFFESFNREKFRGLGIDLDWVQDNHARSSRGTLRGLHFQRGRGQDKLVRCTLGAIWDVAVDIRPGSPTLGKWTAVELTAENKKMFFVPVGFAHGYAVLSDAAECLYKCTNVYIPELEDGFRWNDPDVGAAWPVENPILSKRDRESQSFRECIARIERDAAGK